MLFRSGGAGGFVPAQPPKLAKFRHVGLPAAGRAGDPVACLSDRHRDVGRADAGNQVGFGTGHRWRRAVGREGRSAVGQRWLTAEILRSDFFTICSRFPRLSPKFFEKKVGFRDATAP